MTFAIGNDGFCGVGDVARTRDLLNHNQVLYQLSYAHHPLCRSTTMKKYTPHLDRHTREGPWRKVDLSASGRLAQLVRAPRLHRGCRGFEPLIAHLLFPPTRENPERQQSAQQRPCAGTEASRPRDHGNLRRDAPSEVRRHSRISRQSKRPGHRLSIMGGCFSS